MGQTLTIHAEAKDENVVRGGRRPPPHHVVLCFSQHLRPLYLLLWRLIEHSPLGPFYIVFLGRLGPQIIVFSASLSLALKVNPFKERTAFDVVIQKPKGSGRISKAVRSPVRRRPPAACRPPLHTYIKY